MLDFYAKIDQKASQHAELFMNMNKITTEIVNMIIELYNDVKIEKQYDSSFFESAYQMSITPLFEFYLARFLFHTSLRRKYGWKIFLRRQIGKCAPDLRIEKDGRTIGIIEVKIKGGWIQSFFSEERFKNDKTRLAQGKSKYDPQETINSQNIQLQKYKEAFHDPLVFMLLPTFNMVHRKHYSANYQSYKDNFTRNTGKDGRFLVVMSRNLRLNLAEVISDSDMMITNEFENMMNEILKMSE